MSSPAKDLDENQAATLAAGAGQVLSETLASAKADLAEYIGDDNNFEKLFNVLKMGGYEPLAKYESFPAAGKEREELRATLTSEPEKVVEALDSINQTFDQKKEEGGLKEWVMGLYEKSPTAFAIGAQFLGRALGLDPTLVQIGLQMLEEFTNEKNGKGASEAKAEEPEEPVGKSTSQTMSAGTAKNDSPQQATVHAANPDVMAALQINGGQIIINPAPAASFDNTLSRATQAVEAGKTAAMPLGA